MPLGQTRLPSAVGSVLGSTIGRPLASISFAHVTCVYGLPEQVRAGHAIEHVEEPVAVRDRHELARPAGDRVVEAGSACAWNPSRARRAA